MFGRAKRLVYREGELRVVRWEEGRVGVAPNLGLVVLVFQVGGLDFGFMIDPATAAGLADSLRECAESIGHVELACEGEQATVH